MDVALKYGAQNKRIETVCKSAASTLKLIEAENMNLKHQLDSEQERRVKAEEQRDDAENRCDKWKELLDMTKIVESRKVPATLARISPRFPYERIAETLEQTPCFFMKIRKTEKGNIVPNTQQVSDWLAQHGYANMFVRYESKCFDGVELIANLDALENHGCAMPDIGKFVVSGEIAFVSELDCTSGKTSVVKQRAAKCGFGDVISALCYKNKMIIFRLDMIKTYDLTEETS